MDKKNSLSRSQASKDSNNSSSPSHASVEFDGSGSKLIIVPVWVLTATLLIVSASFVASMFFIEGQRSYFGLTFGDITPKYEFSWEKYESKAGGAFNIDCDYRITIAAPHEKPQQQQDEQVTRAYLATTITNEFLEWHLHDKFYHVANNRISKATINGAGSDAESMDVVDLSERCLRKTEG